MQFLLSILLLLLPLILQAQNIPAERVYTQVENMPRICECAGAKDNMYKLDKCTLNSLNTWTTQNMNYPAIALEKGTRGICKVHIILDTTGRITEPLLIQKVSPECDDEALKLISILSNQEDTFLPGTQSRKKVKVALVIPIEFNPELWKIELDRRRKLLEETQKQDSAKINVPAGNKRK